MKVARPHLFQMVALLLMRKDLDMWFGIIIAIIVFIIILIIQYNKKRAYEESYGFHKRGLDKKSWSESLQKKANNLYISSHISFVRNNTFRLIAALQLPRSHPQSHQPQYRQIRTAHACIKQYSKWKHAGLCQSA